MQTKPVYDSANLVPHALEELQQALKYKYLLFQLIRRDLLTRYKRSVLGIAWTMLNPLGTMIILSIVFSRVFGSTRALPTYILSGLIAWNFFAQSTHAAMFSIVWGGGLLQRIYVPRAAFGLSAVGSALVNVLFALVPLSLVLLVTGVHLTWSVLFLPVPLVLLACFSLGVGLALSTMAAYFPDVAEMYQVILVAWMYLTPILYPETIFPPQYAWLLRINPMYYLVKLWRLPLYDGRLPAWGELLPAAAISIVVLLLGWFFFTSKSDEFAYRV